MFYAHTISPIMIALLTSAVMVIFMGRYSPVAAVYAAAVYIIVGIFIPLWNGKRGGQTGMEFRTSFGELNSFVLVHSEDFQKPYSTVWEKRKDMRCRNALKNSEKCKEN